MLKSACKQNSISSIPTSKFVYFAMCYEHERTTTPEGGIFHDQLIAIANLRSILPRNVLIVVKEHPSQFYFGDKGSRGRSRLFYQCVKNINGVIVISTNVETIELIEKSEFVATVSGTVAIEAASRKKKAIVFGDAWFTFAPNIMSWGDKLTYKKIMSAKLYKVEDVIAYLVKKAKKYTVPGFLNPSYQDLLRDFEDEKFFEAQKIGVFTLMKKFIQENG